MLEYLDFELEVTPGSGQLYPVVVTRSPAGEAREMMHFPFGELELENRLQALQIAFLRSGGQRRQSLSSEQRTVQGFGRTLFDALMIGDVRVRYDVSLARAQSQDKGLRLKLRVNAPEIAVLPWEFLYDPRRAEYVCLSRDTPIVRYLELPQPIQPLTITPPLRILGMIANPSDLGTLNAALEKQRVEDALHTLQAAGLVMLTWLEGQTWRALQRAMRLGEWHVFHFIGHGDFDTALDEGLVMLPGEDGKARRLSATQLGRLLANHRALRLALLNACEGATGSAHDLFSSTASILVRHGLPSVLAMQYPVTDRAAIEFARTFYESLVDGLPVDAAVVESRVAISMAINNTLEWGAPVLFMRSPDGVIFNIQKTEALPEVQLHNLKPVEPVINAVEDVSHYKQKSAPSDIGGLPGVLCKHLHAVLLSCGVFDSDRRLRAVFLDARVTQWRDQLPEATNPSERVQFIVDSLYARTASSGENGLVLLLQVLRDLTDTDDALYSRLNALATEVITWSSSQTHSGCETLGRTIRQDKPTTFDIEAATAVAMPEQVVKHRQQLLVARQPFEPELLFIPAGEFSMGDVCETVYLPDYAIARTPTTNAQYQIFTQATRHSTPDHWSDGAPPQSSLDHPVVGVSWQDAVAYCEWLSDVADRLYRLPTEEEWEKAARGVDGRQYPWGNHWQEGVCNTSESGIRGTTPVGRYSPQGDSVYGCVDMAGNVWEWTNSCSATAIDERILCGGAWRSGYHTTGCVSRLSLPHDLRYDNLGFRCASLFEFHNYS